jgi:hypothetical protein
MSQNATVYAPTMGQKQLFFSPVRNFLFKNSLNGLFHRANLQRTGGVSPSPKGAKTNTYILRLKKNSSILHLMSTKGFFLTFPAGNLFPVLRPYRRPFGVE